MMKTIEQNADVGVIIARFQSPYLHEGHIDIINQVLTNHPRVIIYLGNSPVRCSKNNPLDFQARKAMIESIYPNIEVYSIDDVGDNDIWSRTLDKLIRQNIGPNQKVVLYGSRDSFIAAYHGQFPTIELVPTKLISASQIRRNIGIKSKNTQEFREGAIWVVENQSATVHPTVDIAIIDYQKPRRILLCRKLYETKYRFIGGFADVNSPSYEDDARREVMEETGLVIDEIKYLFSTLIPDWRYKYEPNKIKTLFFIAPYNGGTPQANDDIVECKWFDLETLKKDDIVSIHHELYKYLKTTFGFDPYELTEWATKSERC